MEITARQKLLLAESRYRAKRAAILDEDEPATEWKLSVLAENTAEYQEWFNAKLAYEEEENAKKYETIPLSGTKP